MRNRFGHLGTAADPVAAAEQRLAAATAAMNAPTCTQGPARGLPAVVCNPDLAKAVEEAAAALAEAKGGGMHKHLMLVGALAVVGVGGFLWWRHKNK